MFKLSASLLALALVAFPANAQSPIYGQCGGQGWTGATTCASGSVCTFSNPYYSQCLPGSATTTSASSTRPTTTTTGGGSPTTTSAAPAPTDAGNPFVGYTTFLIPEYVSEVQAAVANISDATTAASAAKVAEIPVFFWMDVAAKVPTLGTYLAAANAAGGKQLVQAVIYDLPDRDCAAESSAGEFTIANGGAADYMAYIDAIAAQVQQYPNVRVVFVVEPDGLANLVTNLSVEKCANAQTTYIQLVSYAISKLQFPNVFLYLDAGHSGWLGWPANITPAAQLFAQVLKGAGSGATVRGLATDVSNYNLLRGTEDPAQSPNPNYDEELYINALAPLLTQNGFPAHFIVDPVLVLLTSVPPKVTGATSRVPVSALVHPPTLATLIDSIVWVKPPGESDGTSNSSAARYDTHCGQSDAAQPAPEAGTWFQSYFVTLVQNANPPL
ncbi:glycoside hydrolase family 6 protein [Sphaerobolus stellatus SS14]|uniref:Glucanase n=1 Tax=Sphaerobolus stellatus (strain SS14) TaxID=990650 RepID=A0A0C9VIX1_SPHS4|nr:glycoside hydrolase family 6 protein [Sphaerobolus stellatus SS14]